MACRAPVCWSKYPTADGSTKKNEPTKKKPSLGGRIIWWVGEKSILRSAGCSKKRLNERKRKKGRKK